MSLPYTSTFSNNLNSSLSPNGNDFAMKSNGYMLGDPTLVKQVPVISSRTASRIVYGPQTIVHEHPSRPARSPSPISHNPNANIIPQTNFIYNGTTEPLSRVISYSPAKLAPTTIVSTVVSDHVLASSKNNVNVNVSMVPKAQYDKCVYECKVWEERYSELYRQFMSQGQIGQSNRDQEYQMIVRENRKLKERVRELQVNQSKVVNNFEQVLTNLVNKYRDSTLKQCMLLTDRYRLEKKMAER